MTHDTFDDDAVYRGECDRAAAVGIDGAAGNIGAIAVVDGSTDQDADPALVGAAGDLDPVGGTHDATDEYLRSRGDADGAGRRATDVRPRVDRRDLATQADIAVGQDAYQHIAALLAFRPQATAGAVGDDAAAIEHLDADTGERRAGLDRDAAAGGEFAAQAGAGVAEHEVALRGQVDGRVLAGVGPSDAAAAHIDEVDPRAQCTADDQRLRLQLHHAVVGGAEDLAVDTERDAPCRRHFDAAVAFDQRAAGCCAGRADVDGITGLQANALAGGLGADRRVVDLDIVAGDCQQRAGELEAAVQFEITRRGDGDFVVVTRGGGGAALDEATDVDIAAGKLDQRTGFKPARRLGIGAFDDGQRTLRGDHAQQPEQRVVAANHRRDDDVIDTAEHDPATGIDGRQMARAKGAQADLAFAHHAAGVDDDVALRGQVGLEHQGVAGVDDDIGIGAARDQLALQRDVAGRVELHAAGQGFEPGGGGQRDRCVALHIAAGVELDAAVRADRPRDQDLAAGCIRAADFDHRAGAAGVDGVGPRRGLVAVGCNAGGSDLSESQQFGAPVSHRGDSDLVVAGEIDPAVVQPDQHIGRTYAHHAAHGRAAGGRRGDDEIGRRDGVLQVLHQAAQALIANRCSRGQAHDTAGGVGAEVDRDAQCGVGAQMPIGKLRESISNQFFGPGRRQHREVARCGQRDRAVVGQGFQLHIAADQHAVFAKGIGRVGRCHDAAAHVDGLAGDQVAGELDAFVGLNDDRRIAAKGAHRAAQVQADRVVVVDQLATGDELAVDIGAAGRADIDRAVGVGDDHARGTGQLDADAFRIGATDQLDALVGEHHRADIDVAPAVGDDRGRQPKLAAGAQPRGRILGRPGDGL